MKPESLRGDYHLIEFSPLPVPILEIVSPLTRDHFPKFTVHTVSRFDRLIFFSPELSLTEQNKNWICLFSCRHPRIRPVPIAVIKNHFSGKSLEFPSWSGFPISRDKIMPKNGCRRVFPKSATFPLPLIENMCKERSQFKKINVKQIEYDIAF